MHFAARVHRAVRSGRHPRVARDDDAVRPVLLRRLRRDGRRLHLHGLQMAWFDRQGKQVEAVGSAGNYRGIDLAPDGTHVAAHRHDGNGGDIWVTDLARSTTSRFTFDASQENTSPIWSPDATHIVYGSTRNGKSGLYQKQADNAGSEERLVESNDTPLPMRHGSDGT